MDRWPLFRATSALRCLPASSCVASATQFFSSRSWYNPFNNLQVRSRRRQGLALGSKITFGATVALHLATSSCNPTCQERRSIIHALLCAAVPMRLVPAGCKPRKQERHTNSKKHSRSADNANSTRQIRHWSEHASFFLVIFI